jgi:hypothetical protein
LGSVTSESADRQRLCFECRQAGKFSICETCCKLLIAELGIPLIHPSLPYVPWMHVHFWLPRRGEIWREVSFPVEPTKIRTVGLKTAWAIRDWERWRSYELDLFGLDLGTKADGMPGPIWPCSVGGGVGSFIQVWSKSARYAGSPLRAQVTWHPERGERWSITGPPHSHTKDDLKRASDGFRLIETIERRGKNVGDGLWWDIEEFRRRFWAAMYGIPKDARPTKGRVRAALSIRKHETLINYMDRAGIVWEEAVRERARKLGLIK